MKNRIIMLITIIIIFILLFTFPYKVDNNTINNKTSIESVYYLNHNLTIENNKKCYINNQNISIFQNNVNIIDNGFLSLNNSSIITNNVKLNLIIHNSTFVMDNSIINITGKIHFYNSTIIIKNSKIINQTTLYIQSNKSNINIFNSTINYGQFNSKNVNFTSGMLYNKNSPQDAQGPIPIKSDIYYNNSYSNRLNLHFYIKGDNNGTGNILFYEHTLLIDNMSIPVHTGYYYFNTSINLPEDLLPENFTNTSDFSMVIPTDNSPQPHPAGEDGNITFENITAYINSNDTESYYGFNGYNIIFRNSTILSYNSSFNTNFKNLYIYQKILNPYKKSILMYNSTFYSISSHFGSNIYINSPFHDIHSSSFIYGIKKIYFTNGYNYFNLNYTIKPRLFNNSMDKKANYYNSLIKAKIKCNKENILLFDIQHNNASKYYGDYYAKNDNNTFNFSFKPIPSFGQANKLYLNVNIANIEYKYNIPNKFVAFKNNKIALNLTSLYFHTNVNINLLLNNKTYYQNNININKNELKNIYVNIINNNSGISYLKISLESINKNYSFNQFLNKTIKIDFLKDVNISILTNDKYTNNKLSLNTTIINNGMNNVTSYFIVYYYNNSGIIKSYKSNLTLYRKSLKNINLTFNMSNVTKIREFYYNYSNEIKVNEISKVNKTYALNVSTNINGSWELMIKNKTMYETNKNISISLKPGYYNITIFKSNYRNESYAFYLNSNYTIVASLVKSIKKVNDVKNNNINYDYIYFGIISSIAVLSSFLLYSFKTIKCPKCGTLYFRKYDKCPVCLYNRKNK